MGLAAGFIEPLESTGLGLIQDVAEFFVHFSPDLSWDSAFADKLNSFLAVSHEFIRDFVASTEGPIRLAQRQDRVRSALAPEGPIRLAQRQDRVRSALAA